MRLFVSLGPSKGLNVKVMPAESRRADLAIPYRPRKTIEEDDYMAGGFPSHMCSFIAMMTKNRFIAWFSLILATDSYFATKDRAKSISTLTFSLFAILITYAIHFTLPDAPKPTI